MAAAAVIRTTLSQRKHASRRVAHKQAVEVQQVVSFHYYVLTRRQTGKMSILGEMLIEDATYSLKRVFAEQAVWGKCYWLTGIP